MLLLPPGQRIHLSALMRWSVTSTAVLAIACVPGSSSNGALSAADDLRPTATASAVRTGAATDHVGSGSVDGLRPDAIARFNAVTMGRLAREGSHSLAATTINPSKTRPSH